MNPKMGFLIDIDGVILRGNDLIPGADAFLKKLHDLAVPFLLVTNDTQPTRRDLATKLDRVGIPADESKIFTCATATARFLALQKPQGTAYVLGEGGLLHALHQNGYSIVDHDADYVIVGETRSYTSEMLETAVRMIIRGSRLIATHLTASTTGPAGPRPGSGSIIALLESATGVKALNVGKPSPIMMREARKALGSNCDETTMIGDTMESDIFGGVQMGYRTVLVLSGATKTGDLSQYAYRPDLIVDSVAALCSPSFLPTKAGKGKSAKSVAA